MIDNEKPQEIPEPEEQQDGLPTEPDPPPPAAKPKAARKPDTHDAHVIKDRKPSPKAKRTNSPPHGFSATTLIVE